MPWTAYACRAGTTTLLRPTERQLRELLEEPDVATVWIDVVGANADDQALLADLFGLHPLMIEDILQESQPKLEVHPSYTYIIIHGIDPSHRSPDDLKTIDLDLLLAKNFVLTHHDGPLLGVDDVRKNLDLDPRILQRHPSFLAHTLLDHVVDNYLPLMDDYAKAVDELELGIMRQTSGDRNVLERIFDLKHSLQRIRRVGIHQKDILHRLARGELELIPKDAIPFYRDVYDHFLRVSDLADSYRDLVSAALDVHLSVQSHRMNEVMKVLTLISTIMLPLTFLTGFFGMNFEYMPGLHWKYGYEAAAVVMIGISITMAYLFKRRRWL